MPEARRLLCLLVPFLICEILLETDHRVLQSNRVVVERQVLTRATVQIVEIVDLCVWVSNVLLCKGLTVQELLPGSMSFLRPCGSSGRGHSYRGGDGMWIHTGFFKKTAILSHPLRRNLHAPFPPIQCFYIALLGKAFKKTAISVRIPACIGQQH